MCVQSDAWAYVSPPLLGVTFSFGICCTDADLGGAIDAMLAPLRADGSSSRCADHWFELHHGTGPDRDGFRLSLDGQLLVSAACAASALAWLLWHLNRAVAAAAHDHVLLHAGGIARGDVGVVFPAPSGSGKSTLVGGLVRRGMGYMSDELLGLSLDGSSLVPFPKPLSMASDTGVLLFGPAWAHETSSPPRRGSVPVEPDRLRSGSVVTGPIDPKVMVVPRYRPGGRSTLVPIAPEDAVIELALNAVNLPRLRGGGVHALGVMARRCTSFRLEMSDLDEACALVEDAVDEIAGSPHRAAASATAPE
jgi:hypothetical protein